MARFISGLVLAAVLGLVANSAAGTAKAAMAERQAANVAALNAAE